MPKEKPYTRDDALADLAAVRESLERSGLDRLVRHVEERAVTAGASRWRLPMGLSAEPSPDVIVIRKQVPRLSRVTHLVLTPESARAYEGQLFVGVDLKQLDYDPLPLDVFSIEHAGNDALATILAWNAGVAEPGVMVQLALTPRKGMPHPLPPLRGILWLEVLW